jgi:hypothetical protein
VKTRTAVLHSSTVDDLGHALGKRLETGHSIELILDVPDLHGGDV